MLRAVARPEVVPFVMFGFAVVLSLLAVEQSVHIVVPLEVTVISGGTTFFRGTMLDWEVTGLLAVFVAGLGLLARVGHRKRPVIWCFVYGGAFVSILMLALLVRYTSDTSISSSMVFDRFEGRRRRGDVTFYNGSHFAGDPRPPSNEDPYWWHGSKVLVRTRVDPIWAMTLIACAAFSSYHVIACATLLRNSKNSLSGKCNACGYPRVGLEPGARCPECGARPTLAESTESREPSRPSSDGA